MDLKSLKKTVNLRPPLAIFYGAPGIGKSVLASQAPDHIFLNCNNGLDGIASVKFPIRPEEGEKEGTVFRTFNEVVRAIGTLYTEEHDFKTVVIDALSDVERLIWNQVCLENNVKEIEQVGFGRGYKYARSYWGTLLDGLEALRDKRNMFVLILAHSVDKKYNDPLLDGEYNRIVPLVNDKIFDRIDQWADAVILMDQKVYTNEIETGFGKKSIKTVGGGRVLYTCENPRHVAKNRYGLPNEILLPNEESMYDTFIQNFNTCATKRMAQADPKTESAPPKLEESPETTNSVQDSQSNPNGEAPSQPVEVSTGEQVPA